MYLYHMIIYSWSKYRRGGCAPKHANRMSCFVQVMLWWRRQARDSFTYTAKTEVKIDSAWWCACKLSNASQNGSISSGPMGGRGWGWILFGFTW